MSANVTKFQPGDMVRAYAEKRGWRLARRSVMVEGDSDVRYFEFAAREYFKVDGKRLIGDDFSVFAAGSGDAGGTDGLYEEFPTLWKLARGDTDSNGKAMYRVASLVDNDQAGRLMYEQFLRQYRAMLPWRDVFHLQHVFPVRSSEPGVLAKHMQEANAGHVGLDCEIEDLLESQVIEAFLEDNPDALARPTQATAGFSHYEFREASKSRLWLFAKENCQLGDLNRIVETLKAMRFYMGVPADGI